MNFRRLRTLIVREFRATLRDPFTISTLIAVPILALMVFGAVLSTEVRDLRLGVLDADRSKTSRELVTNLTVNDTFEARSYSTREALDDALVAGDVSIGLVIPPDFERGIGGWSPGREGAELQVLYDGAEAVLAGNAEAQLRAVVARTIAAPGAAPPIQVVSRALFNPTLDGVPFMVAGTFGFVLSFLTTLLTAVSIVNERQQGTFEQLQVTPATSLEILLGKLLPLGAVFAFDVVLMVAVAGLLLGVWPAGSATLFLVISTFYVLMSLAIGLVLSATSATAAEAVQKTVLLSVPLVQLSGFLFPVRSMPAALAWATELFPATHYIRVSRAIYLRGEGFFDVFPDLVFLAVAGMALVAYALRSIEARA